MSALCVGSLVVLTLVGIGIACAIGQARQVQATRDFLDALKAKDRP